MSSNLKVNTILPSTGTTIGIGTVGGLINVVGNIDVNSTSGISTFNGLEISGIVTAKAGAAVTYYGDGSNLTGITQTTINNNADNRVITGSGTANTLEGEANLTFDGTNLRLGTTTAAIGGGTGIMVASSTGARIKLCDSDAGVTANDGFEIIAGNGGTGYINNKENQAIVISTNNTERMRVTHEGSVGIGTNNSSYELEVHDGTGAAALRMKDGANNVICDLIANSTGGLLRTTYNHPLVFHTNQVERVRITSAGSVLASNSFVSKATADVNVTISTASGFTANTFVTVINHGVLEEESVYIISFKWNHGSSGQQPYFSHGAFVFNPSEVNTGSTGGQGPNYAPFQGHHMHTGVNRYWSFRYYGATGGTSVHGLQAAFDQTLNQSSGTLTIRATKIAKVTTI